MEIHRPSASAMRIPHRGPALDRRPPSSRSTSHTSFSSSHSREPMAIPGAPIDEPPPPLPPPRFNEELDRGIDVAWAWQNSEMYADKSKLAPIKPSSSLYGGYMHARGDTRRTSGQDDIEMDMDWDRRGSSVSTIRSPSHTEISAGASMPVVPSVVRRPPSPIANSEPNANGAPSSQRLQGDKPLAQENHNRSSHAYDQRLLSKIGKPNSPPRHLRSESAESVNMTQKLSLQTKDSKAQRRTPTDPSSASLDSVSRWVSSPMSGGLSPASRPNWRDYNMDHRSPSHESTAASLVLDPELFVPSRTTIKASLPGSHLGHDDGVSVTSRSERSSYDQVMFTDADSDMAQDDSNGLRNLNLSEPHRQLERQASRQGLKRRALSPPAEVARDDKAHAYPAELFQKLSSSNHSVRSPASIYRAQPNYGSVSSTNSSIHPNSYTSSFAPSLAGSSLTSTSSFDRHSPSDPSQPHPFLASAPPASSPATAIAPSRSAVLSQSPRDPKAISRKMSIHTAVNEPRPPVATRLVGSHWICDCCPKKPKKFDSEDELRAHQMEKQYACQYCNNRFKNKNEAERHQNSVHLRRHSWSCAAIPDPRACFHPSSSPTSQAPTGALTDACGYCGEEFANLPRPDWDRRLDHLTNIHKFGECNQAKKFYRADHFRQHLKHSHAGQSGKWTNMLESVCLKEEPPTEIAGLSPTGSDGGQGRGPSSLPGPADIPMGGATISEAREES